MSSILFLVVVFVHAVWSGSCAYKIVPPSTNGNKIELTCVGGKSTLFEQEKMPNSDLLAHYGYVKLECPNGAKLGQGIEISTILRGL